MLNMLDSIEDTELVHHSIDDTELVHKILVLIALLSSTHCMVVDDDSDQIQNSSPLGNLHRCLKAAFGHMQ